MAKKSSPNAVAENRKARHEYHIDEVFEAGIVLQGSEVKSLRAGAAHIGDSYAAVENGELWIINAYIPEYEKAAQFSHVERRPRKLLMKRREIAKLAQATDRQGMTLVPLKVFFNDDGRAKVLLGLAKGKKLHDKRESDKERDWNRDKRRLLKHAE